MTTSLRIFLIGCWQPQADSVAQKVAEEINQNAAVAARVRYYDEVLAAKLERRTPKVPG